MSNNYPCRVVGYLPAAKLFVLLIACLPLSGTSVAMESPAGIFCSCPPTNDNSNSVLAGLEELGFVDGVLVRVGWNDIETAPGQYEWENLDRQFQLAQDAGMKVAMGIVNGRSAPAWLQQEGAAMFEYDFHGEVSRMPFPWDTAYLDRWDQFVQELGNRYSNHPMLELVHVTHSSLNGFEMQMPTVNTAGETWEDVGYTTALHVESWNTVVDSFASAFPSNPLDVEIHPVLGPDDLRGIGDGDNNEVAKQVIASGVSEYPEQFGSFAAWWSLSNAAEVYPGMFDIMEATAPTNFGTVQIVGNVTNQPERFGGEAGNPPEDILDLEFDETLQLALDVGVRYMEVWNADLFNPELAGLLSWVHEQVHTPIPEPSSLVLFCLAILVPLTLELRRNTAEAAFTSADRNGRKPERGGEAA